jgi:hypothetical protein
VIEWRMRNLGSIRYIATAIVGTLAITSSCTRILGRSQHRSPKIHRFNPCVGIAVEEPQCFDANCSNSFSHLLLSGYTQQMG